jgi:putative endonuclease
MEQSPRKPWWRRWFGTRSETAAATYLKKIGYRILFRNYRCNHGEIDLVALDGRCIVFVEVRSSSGEDLSVPAASVDEVKQRRLTNLALTFLKSKRLLDHPARFDVLAVSWPDGQREPLIEHHPHAFQAAGRFQMFS